MKNNLKSSFGDTLRVYFVNCRKDGVDETPLLRKMMAFSKNYRGIEVGSPNDANLILITGILEHNVFEALRANHIWQQYPEKCFGFSEVDNVPTFLHGVYASASRLKGFFNRMQSGGYPWIRAWRSNPIPLEKSSFQFSKEYLFSFIGRKSHPVRKKLFHASWPIKDVLVADITRSYNHWIDEGHAYREKQAQYWHVVAKSKFVLCPRGQGASSIRLFEAMEAGVAPVIISDIWIPAVGPNWDEFALFIPERKIYKIYDILKARENEWLERGKLAQSAYNKWFAPEMAWDQLLLAIETIRMSQTIPEKWFVRGKCVLFGFELLHQWRYSLPIRLKSIFFNLKLGNKTTNS